jgi:hypothetical protein
MSANSYRRIDIYTFVKVGSTGWIEVVLVRLSWTTASWHGVVVHHRTSAPDRQSWPATAETTRYGGCPDHSSEAHEQATEPMHSFLCIAEGISQLELQQLPGLMVKWEQVGGR